LEEISASLNGLPRYLRYWLDMASRAPREAQKFAQLTCNALEVIEKTSKVEEGSGYAFWKLTKVKKALRGEYSNQLEFRNYPEVFFDRACELAILELADMGLLVRSDWRDADATDVCDKVKLSLKQGIKERVQLQNYRGMLENSAVLLLVGRND